MSIKMSLIAGSSNKEASGDHVLTFLVSSLYSMTFSVSFRPSLTRSGWPLSSYFDLSYSRTILLSGTLPVRGTNKL